MTKPTERPDYITAHCLVTVDKATGMFMIQTASTTEPGDFGSGFYSSLDKAQKQQLVLALKGIQVEVYTLEYPIRF